MASFRDDVPSPCIKVCVMDDARGLCRGCLRTLNEIAAWSSMSAREKRDVLARLELRRRTAVPER